MSGQFSHSEASTQVMKLNDSIRAMLEVQSMSLVKAFIASSRVDTSGIIPKLEWYEAH